MYTRDQLFVDGKWAAPQGDSVITVVSPHSGTEIGRAVCAGALDVDRAVGAARAAFDTGPWPRMQPSERIEAIGRLAGIYKERRADMAALISAEIGAPISFAKMAQVRLPLTMMSAFCGIAASYPWQQDRAGVYGKDIRIVKQPVGVVAAIVPWNMPQFLTVAKVVPALLAGCTVVLKPAPESVLDAQLLADLVAEADLPPGVFNVVPGGRDVGEQLVSHDGVDKVSFTGSTAAGRIIGGVCGQALKPVTLELGGKSAAVILDDADLSTVMPGLAYLSFINTGQSCFLNSRVLAPRPMYDQVVDGLSSIARSFVLGQPLDPATTMGPLVSERQRERVEGFIATGKAEGALVTAGGGRPRGLDRGWFLEPTIFSDVDNSMTIAREEIFGPVICVIPYDTDDEAVQIANDTEYGLAGSVWGTDTERALSLARRVETGTIGLNMWTLDPGSPFGGWKSSGLGKELGPEGLDAYLNTKSINVPS